MPCRHLEPTEAARPEFLADVSGEVAGVFRLGAAAALLRLARRHDTRIIPSCYCMLALMMQDDLDTVRAAFSVKVFKLVQHFLVSGHSCWWLAHAAASAAVGSASRAHM